jgi:hypothetical protein
LHGIDENSAGEVAGMLAYLRELQRQLDLSVILVHHTLSAAGPQPNGIGSRFRATINHMENAFSENDSRPLPQNATLIHLPVLKRRYTCCGASPLSHHARHGRSSRSCSRWPKSGWS